MDQYKYIVSTPLNLGKGKAGWVILEICQKRGGGGWKNILEGGVIFSERRLQLFPNYFLTTWEIEEMRV